MGKIELTIVEIIDWCLFGLKKGNPEGVPPLLEDLKQALQQLDDNVCPLCGTKHVELHRFSGIEV